MALSAGISAGSGALFKGVDGVLGKAAVAAGTSYATSVTTGFISAVNWGDLGGDWLDEDAMFESAFGAGTIASALSAGATVGIQAAAIGLADDLLFSGLDLGGGCVPMRIL
jgi:hypothetical protein